ncbi:MAG: glycosyltransferase family 87 protein, partial [Chloroflexota bacterium]|nr:glycosyltransferase family 87 protein [Chloroflexota bacterium]
MSKTEFMIGYGEGVDDRTTALGKRLASLLALCLLWLVIAAVLYVVFVSRTNHTDFFPRWAGARMALFEARDPYAETSTREIQRRVYGSFRQDTQDQQGFAYPAHVIPLLFPFWLLPMRVASALWSSLSIMMVVVLVYLLGQVPRRLVWVFASVVLIAQVLLVVFQAQFTIFVAACLGIAYWMYTRSYDVIAGALLACATIKPELVSIPMVVLIVMAVWERRWKLVFTVLLTLLLLVSLSFGITGIWVPRWLAQISAYQTYAQSVWPVKVLYQHELVSGLVFVILLVLGLKVTRWDRDLVFATACVLGLVLIPQTLPYSLVLLLVP